MIAFYASVKDFFPFYPDRRLKSKPVIRLHPHSDCFKKGRIIFIKKETE